jgi:hypothetical protein
MKVWLTAFTHCPRALIAWSRWRYTTFILKNYTPDVISSGELDVCNEENNCAALRVSLSSFKLCGHVCSAWAGFTAQVYLGLWNTAWNLIK